MHPPLVSLSQAPLTKTDAQLVAEACGRAAKALGLSREEQSAVVGASTAPAQPARAGIPLIVTGLSGSAPLIRLS